MKRSFVRYLQADGLSRHRCHPVAVRDTDLDWTAKIVAVSKGPVAGLANLRNRTLPLGSRDSGHAAILTVHFLEQQGLFEEQPFDRISASRRAFFRRSLVEAVEG